MKTKEINPKDWSRFIAEAMNDEFDEESYSNFNIGFKRLTKRYGSQYIEYCKAAWQANDGILSEEEFCYINGEIPKGFFKSKIETHGITPTGVSAFERPKRKERVSMEKNAAFDLAFSQMTKNKMED